MDDGGAPGDAGTGTGTGGSDGGSAPVDGGGAPNQPVPAPVDTPYVWGVGLGVSDMDAAVTFFTEVMEMTVEKQDQVRSDRTETILWAAEADRGSRLVLMKYDDGRATRNISAKLVWQASNPGAVNRKASSYPDYEERLGLFIYQFDGPDTYIQEVGSIFDSGSGSDAPYLISLGFSTSDLRASRTFYTTAFGMDESSLGSFRVTDATGSGRIEEYAVVYPTGGGAGLVLQDWDPMRNSKDNPVKIVLAVPDAQAAADAVVAAGGSIVEPAARTPVYDNRLVIVTADPDGYLIELVE